jgi:hypothetical protein
VQNLVGMGFDQQQATKVGAGQMGGRVWGAESGGRAWAFSRHTCMTACCQEPCSPLGWCEGMAGHMVSTSLFDPTVRGTAPWAVSSSSFDRCF